MTFASAFTLSSRDIRRGWLLRWTLPPTRLPLLPGASAEQVVPAAQQSDVFGVPATQCELGLLVLESRVARTGDRGTRTGTGIFACH